MNDEKYYSGPQDKAEEPQPPAPKNTENTARSQQEAETRVDKLQERMGGHERGMLRWTRAVAFFALVSTVFSGIYVYAFIESERAYLVVNDPGMINGEPSDKPDGLASHAD